MKRLAVLAVATLMLAAVIMTPGTAIAKQHGIMMHFTRGHDIILPDGSPGWTVDAEVVAVVDPTNQDEMKRHARAAWMVLHPGLELSAKRRAQYAAATLACPEDPAALLGSPPILDDGGGDGGCKFGDPECPDWKTRMPGYCAFAAVDCLRKPR